MLNAPRRDHATDLSGTLLRRTLRPMLVKLYQLVHPTVTASRPTQQLDLGGGNGKVAESATTVAVGW